MIYIKKPSLIRELFRGRERIRTAVEAFAELCLATRPQDLLDWQICSDKTTNRVFIRTVLFAGSENKANEGNLKF